jgi:hypothetical protein
MTTFNYTVDTHPMADEISSVSHHVENTTSAVIAMKTAVVMAEEKAANFVCENVNKGFYSLIRSQISQKMSKLKSEIDSHLMQLVQQKKALLGLKDRMENDYNMISRRYIKLFNDLNRNLKQRIFEIDKPTINFAVKESDKIFNRSKQLVSTVPLTQLESLSDSQAILASNIKYRGLNVIKSIKYFLNEMNTQKDITDLILIDDNEHTETKTICIPAIICECNRDKAGNKNIEIAIPEDELDNVSKSSILNALFANLPQMKWEQRTIFDPRVKEEFRKCVTASSSSHKVKDMTMKLFLSSIYQTF